MKQLFRNHIFWVLFIGICAIIVLFPVFKPGLLVTDDGGWMVIRLSSFYQSFRDGQFPVRFLARLNYSYGYPVSNFLYPGFLYVGSLFHVLGLSFQSSVEAIICISVLAGAVGIFYWLRLYFPVFTSFIGAISFLLSPYLLYDIYVRGSVGEIIAIGVWGWLLYSIESKKVWIYIPLFSFLLICHNTLSLFYAGVLLLLIILKKYHNFIVPSLWAIGMSAFFWIPALLEKRFVIFNSVAVSDPIQYFSATSKLLVASLPYILSAVLILISRDKKHKDTITIFLWLFAITFFLCLPVSTFLWNGYLLSAFVQFPFRLLAIWLFIGPWFIGYIGNTINPKTGTVVSILCICVLGYFAIPYTQSQSIERPEGFYSTNEGTTTVLNEYMPRWVKVFPSRRTSDRMEVSSGNAEITLTKSTSGMLLAEITAAEDSVLQMNTLYYPGWGATLDDKPITISSNNDFGLMRVSVPKGSHQLYLAFRETKSRFAADMLSVISILGYISLYFIPHFYKRYMRMKNTI